jgi:hypothetical protein
MIFIPRGSSIHKLAVIILQLPLNNAKFVQAAAYGIINIQEKLYS